MNYDMGDKIVSCNYFFRKAGILAELLSVPGAKVETIGSLLMRKI